MHSLFVGESFCGKSTAIRHVAAIHKANNRQVFGWLPREEQGWNNVGLDFQTDSGETLLKYLECNWNVTYAIEDAQNQIGRNAGDLLWLTSDSRHRGHHGLFGTQNLTGIDPKLRNNVIHVYGFFSVVQNAEIMARQYNCPEFMQCADLPKGTCIYLNRDTREVAKIKLFEPSNQAKTLVS